MAVAAASASNQTPPFGDSSTPKQFFATWIVDGVEGHVCMCLDSGSDVSTVEVAYLSSALLNALTPLPAIALEPERPEDEEDTSPEDEDHENDDSNEEDEQEIIRTKPREK